MESLKSALTAAQRKAVKAVAAHKNHEVRVEEVQQELKDAVERCESLERKAAD